MPNGVTVILSRFLKANFFGPIGQEMEDVYAQDDDDLLGAEMVRGREKT